MLDGIKKKKNSYKGCQMRVSDGASDVQLDHR